MAQSLLHVNNSTKELCMCKFYAAENADEKEMRRTQKKIWLNDINILIITVSLEITNNRKINNKSNWCFEN